MYNLALMYHEGEGVKQDPGKAIGLMERAAEQGLAQVWHGNPKGQLGLLKIICITFIIVLEMFAVLIFFSSDMILWLENMHLHVNSIQLSYVQMWILVYGELDFVGTDTVQYQWKLIHKEHLCCTCILQCVDMLIQDIYNS